MSKTVIHARDLTKVYRLYAGPGYRFLDMFGFLGDRPGAYTEHAALDGVSLDISRGAKVAIIGRNGAGKSTFLKLVTNVIQPTSGVIEVKGKAHALLQIGSGFHPDFTGRENVHAYLAQLGVSGKEAESRCREIVEFAELEEYIDQPVKTYSSGMAVRLMFSTSTAISPDLLVLDEVLGVGDAYFAHKSYNRIRELCDRDGSTLLLVTHDIYSAVSICERVIWIDRGRVLMDGEGAAVVNAYEDSIRLQEEQRLRLKATQRSKELAASNESTQVAIEVRSADNAPQPCPVYFSRVDLCVGDSTIGSLPLDGASIPGASLQFEGTNWGDAVNWEGRHARAFQNFGSPFHKIGGTISVPQATSLDVGQVHLELDYWSSEPCSLAARCFVNGREISLGPLPPAAGKWTTYRAVPVETTFADKVQELTSAGRQGTGAIVVKSARPTDARHQESYAFKHGDPFELHIAYRINQPGLRERAQVLVAFHRDGVQDVMRTICRQFLFDEQAAREGIVVVRFARLPLANGTYSVTVMVAREGYYDEPQTTYFSINPGVYTCLTRAFDITVEHGGIVGTGTGVVVESEWSMRTPAADSVTGPEIMRIDLPAMVAKGFASEYPLAADATDQVLLAIDGADLSQLAARSPSLAGYDWANYLRCSIYRVVRVLRALSEHVRPGSRILDLGAYFGNFALACRAAGFRVDAIDSYSRYGAVLAPCVALQREAGIVVRDFADAGYDLDSLQGTYDAVVCAGVIEHIPHTPRKLLEAVTAALKPGGVLVLDTPNLGYLYKRLALREGNSIFAPIAEQYFTELPFEGHHREYTIAEIDWMLRAAGHDVLSIDSFNYSVFGQSTLQGEHLAHYREMENDPALREVIFAVSRRPLAGAGREVGHKI